MDIPKYELQSNSCANNIQVFINVTAWDNKKIGIYYPTIQWFMYIYVQYIPYKTISVILEADLTGTGNTSFAKTFLPSNIAQCLTPTDDNLI